MTTASPGPNTSMYRVGDYVYFETTAAGPYAIRRIEELNKTPNGTVEARVMCFYRRADLPASLVILADKHHWGEADPEQDSDDEDDTPERTERVLLKQREVFLSRQIETLPATLIRGHCSVTLLSEVEAMSSYTGREDAFFYALVFDPQQKTLLADRGSIRIGSEYQAAIVPKQKERDHESGGDEERALEELLWRPDSGLSDEQIDQFIIISRSVGTFARALDCSSSVKQPSLHMSAAAASRDITVFHAYQALHAHDYDISAALASLVPPTGPVLCRDEMEDWSSAEASLFEEAIQKYGKDFNDIKKDFLPWKSMKNIIEYFFMWKTTDRYVQQKRIKALESETKVKQVYVPAYNRRSSKVTAQQGHVMVLGKDCDAYPSLTKYSWSQFKKYSRFVPATTTEDCFVLDKTHNSANRLAQLRPGLVIEAGSPTKVGKTRAAFFLRTTPLTRAARRVCRKTVSLTHYARKPNVLIDMKGVRSLAMPLLSSKARVGNLCRFKPKQRRGIPELCKMLGQTDFNRQEWLVLTTKPRPQPLREAFPRPAKRVDGSYIYERIPSSADQPTPVGGRQQMLYKKRPYDEKPADGGSAGGGGGPISKVGRPGPSGQARSYSVNQVAPKGKVATLTRVGAGGQKTVVSWQDAPDDLFYRASPHTKKMRKQMTALFLRRAARKPFRKVI